MSRQLEMCWVILVAFAFLAAGNRAQAQYAAAVVSYNAGTTPAGGYTTAAAAIGSPERMTGDAPYEGAVTPFNPPYLTNQIVSVGESGQITLRLSNYVLPQAGAPEIGVFENVGLTDASFGQAKNPAETFGADSALVEVSQNGTSWVSLGNTFFDIPSNGYADLTNPYSSTAGSVQTDFQQPFTGALSSFDNKSFSDILGIFAGSGGGKWLDISGTGLVAVGYIRFSVADDLNAGTGANFELDAVSISHAAVGAPVVPEPASIALMALGLMASVGRRPRLPAAV